MISLFDEPPRVTLRPDRYPIETEFTVGLLLGIAFEGAVTDDRGKIMVGKQMHGVVCLGDGSVVLLPSAAWSMDWRYEVENDRFVDLAAGKEEQDT